MRCCQVSCIFYICYGGKRLAHLQRLQYSCLDKLFPGYATNPGYQFTSNKIEQVVVIKLCSEIGNLFKILKIGEHILYCKIGTIGKKHQVAGTQAQAAAVA